VILEELSGALPVELERDQSRRRYQFTRAGILHHIQRIAIRAGETESLGSHEEFSPAALAGDRAGDFRMQMPLGGRHRDDEVLFVHPGGMHECAWAG
jgi:hypothetical protein